MADLFGVIKRISASGGSDSVELPPGAISTWRVDSPPDADRWRYTSVHDGAVQVYLREFFLPYLGSDDLWRSLGAADSAWTNTYWSSDQRASVYYLSAHNTAAEARTFDLTVDWRREYILTYFAGTGGTIDGESVQNVMHGESGTPVNAIADAGAFFARWSDGVTDNPRVDADVRDNLTVTAIFRGELGTDLNWFALHGLSPDGDGVSTWRELELLDRFGKGLTLFQEFIVGTDPTDPQSRFIFKGPTSADGNVTLRWIGRAGRRYAIYRRASLNDLAAEGWGDPVYTVDCLEDGPMYYTDPEASSSQQFYRISVQQ